MIQPKLIRVLCLLSLVSSPAIASACAWDRDTLEAEAKGIPDTIRVITGRFERNPDLYYEMRLARVEKQLQSTPDDLELYDDAGVACDRLHRSNEAIAWMGKKLAKMVKMQRGGDRKVLREHRYRYLANLGTFVAHLWLREGADRSRLLEMKRARDLIAAAIVLNPDAHFGREKYQLQAMEWMIAPENKQKTNDSSLPTFIETNLSSEEAHKAVEGLSGLIVLGDAWRSIDVFHALAVALQDDHQKSSVAYLAYLRCFEMIGAGGKSVASTATEGALKGKIKGGYYTETEGYVTNDAALRKQFAMLRAEADEWHAQRTAFVIERLKLGRHPDTDPAFWNGWEAPPASSLYIPTEQEERMRLWRYVSIGVTVCGVLLVSLLLLKFARRKRTAGATP